MGMQVKVGGINDLYSGSVAFSVAEPVERKGSPLTLPDLNGTDP